jgi:hypothetical protein
MRLSGTFAMRHQSINYTAALAMVYALGMVSMPLPAFADPASAYFSESMFEKQLQDQRAAQPGGQWNNAKVNVPSYIGSATDNALGVPDPALGAVTAGQGVLPGGAVPGLGVVGTATQATIAAQTTAIGTGAGGAASGGFSAVSTANAATGAALGVLRAIP